MNFDVLERLYDEAPKALKGEGERQNIPRGIRARIVDRDKGSCKVCDSEAKICHHINPRGESIEENLIMLCRYCHEYVHWLLKKKGWKIYLPFRHVG